MAEEQKIENADAKIEQTLELFRNERNPQKKAEYVDELENLVNHGDSENDFEEIYILSTLLPELMTTKSNKLKLAIANNLWAFTRREKGEKNEGFILAFTTLMRVAKNTKDVKTANELYELVGHEFDHIDNGVNINSSAFFACMIDNMNPKLKVQDGQAYLLSQMKENMKNYGGPSALISEKAEKLSEQYKEMEADLLASGQKKHYYKIMSELLNL